MVLPCSAKVAGADSVSLAKEMMLQPEQNGVVLKSFVSKAGGTHDVLSWAQEVCSIGEPARGQFSYYEGRGARPGESFSQQLQRQVAETFQDRGRALVQQGLAKGDLLQNSVALQTLCTLLEQVMQIHESCTQGGGERVYWKIKMEVNQDGACTKYHDDLVDVRFVFTLAGDGTVLSDNAGVDWDYYDACEGAIPALKSNEDLDPAGALCVIQEWNHKVSKIELATEPGDLTIIKGGKQSKRPCLHRAPYSAGEGMQPLRFLISVDRVPQQDLQEFMDMECEDAESHEEEHAVNAQTQPTGQLLPVTVLSGFLGAGKTSLLSHVLRNQDGLRVAVIVNDMAEVNIDAMLVKTGADIRIGKEEMVEMQNGCICCTLRDDLIENVTKLATEKRFDYLLIESTGISEPMPVATTFSHEHEGKKLLGSVARLDTLVTVVDAKNFLKDYGKGQLLAERPALGAGPEDPRTIANLLADQVECANLIVLNKTDLVKEPEVARLEGLLKKMNPKAKVICSTHGRVEPKLLLDTGSFDMAEAEQMPGWFQELSGSHVPETLEYNISSFVYRAQRPFHPKRLDRLLGDGFDGVLRSKGIIWVAGLHHSAMTWGQAGMSMNVEPGPAWLHGSVDLWNWPADTPSEYKTALHGDRRQELVFIGRNLKEAKLRARLERALVTDAEFRGGQEVWSKWPNPFVDAEQTAVPPSDNAEEERRPPPRKKSAVRKKPAGNTVRKTSAGSAVLRKPAGSRLAKSSSSKVRAKILKKPSRARKS